MRILCGDHEQRRFHWEGVVDGVQNGFDWWVQCRGRCV